MDPEGKPTRVRWTKLTCGISRSDRTREIPEKFSVSRLLGRAIERRKVTLVEDSGTCQKIRVPFSALAPAAECTFVRDPACVACTRVCIHVHAREVRTRGPNLTKSGQMSIPNRGAGRRAVQTHQRRALCVHLCRTPSVNVCTRRAFRRLRARARAHDLLQVASFFLARFKSACDQFLRLPIAETVPRPFLFFFRFF